MPELGAGGGGGDLYQTHELELPDQSSLEQLESLCLEQIRDPETLAQTREALIQAFKSKNKALSLDSYGMKDVSDIPLQELVQILGRGRSDKELWSNDVKGSALRDTLGNRLPKTIVCCSRNQKSQLTSCSIFHIRAMPPTKSYANWSPHSNPGTSTPAPSTLWNGTKTYPCAACSVICVLDTNSFTISTCATPWPTTRNCGLGKEPATRMTTQPNPRSSPSAWTPASTQPASL